MPNPLMRLGVPVRQKTTPPDRPNPVEPIPEHYAGANNPYRGIEDHGIEPNEKPSDPEAGYEGTVPAYFEIEPPAPEVVPVRVVRDDNAHSRTVLRTHQAPLTVGNGPQLLIGRNERRSKVYITAISTGAGDTLWIGGSNDGASVMQGYPLLIANAYREWSTVSQDAIYGNVPPVGGGSAVGTVVNIYLAEEVSIDY